MGMFSMQSKKKLKSHLIFYCSLVLFYMYLFIGVVSAISLSNYTISENVGNNSIYIPGTVIFDELQFDSAGIRFYNFTGETFFQNQNQTWNTKLDFYGVNNLLAYNFNGSIYGSSNVNSNDGNINIRIPPNNSTYVLNNFNLTEGVNRENSPLSITSNSKNTIKTITSTLIDSINITLIVNKDSRYDISSLTFNGVTPSYTDNGPTITLTDLQMNNGNNILLVSYFQMPQGTCSSALGAFATYPALIGLIGVVFLMGMAFLFLYGYTIIKSGEPIDAAQIAVGIVVVIGIGVLVIIGIIAIETLCSVGVVA